MTTLIKENKIKQRANANTSASSARNKCINEINTKKTEEWHRPASSVSAYTSLTFDIFVNSLFVLMWN